MVFTIISAVQEKLTHIIESAEEHRVAEKERLQKEAEVAEQVEMTCDCRASLWFKQHTQGDTQPTLSLSLTS